MARSYARGLLRMAIMGSVLSACDYQPSEAQAITEPEIQDYIAAMRSADERRVDGGQARLVSYFSPEISPRELAFARTVVDSLVAISITHSAFFNRRLAMGGLDIIHRRHGAPSLVAPADLFRIFQAQTERVERIIALNTIRAYPDSAAVARLLGRIADQSTEYYIVRRAAIESLPGVGRHGAAELQRLLSDRTIEDANLRRDLAAAARRAGVGGSDR